MGKFARFAQSSNKVQQAKFEAAVESEIEKQVHALEDKMYLQYQKQLDDRLKIQCGAVRNTYEQYQADTAAIALNELGWGETRINRFLSKWNEVYNYYLPALATMPESDHRRARLDEHLQIIQRTDKIKPFEERYEFLPEITYQIEKEESAKDDIESKT